jgi:alpha-L-fucosidase
MAYYYQRVPDGVLNDRWMPWNPVLATTRWKSMRRMADRLNARATGSHGGLIPPKPPHFDVRTPEYVTFDNVQRDPWECVRGIDQSFGYNRNSDPEHFLDAAELLTMTTDIVSKGGNLLLNVGPRGEDARIPTEQLEIIDALGTWSGTDGISVFGSRPWVRPEGRSTEGHDLRFWSRDRSVFAAVDTSAESRGVDPHGSGAATITIPHFAATSTTTVVDSTGCRVEHEETARGLRVHMATFETRRWPVMELRDVVAR